MKEYGWTLQYAYDYVKQKRSCIKPNKGFMNQLVIYEGILDARWARTKGLFKDCPFMYKDYHYKDGRGLLYWHGLTLIRAWISNQMPIKVWDEITYLFSNFSVCTISANPF